MRFPERKSFKYQQNKEEESENYLGKRILLPVRQNFSDKKRKKKKTSLHSDGTCSLRRRKKTSITKQEEEEEEEEEEDKMMISLPSDEIL
jgi:hypothetical protein